MRKDFWYTVLICLVASTFIIIGTWFMHYTTTYPIYNGQVVAKTEKTIIVEIEVPATPEEIIGYEVGDLYMLGGK